MRNLELDALYAIIDIKKMLEIIFNDNLDNFTKENFIIELYDGTEYYLDSVDGQYEHSLPSLIHKLLYDWNHLERMLPKEIFSEISFIETGCDIFLNFIAYEGKDSGGKLSYIELFDIIEKSLISRISFLFAQEGFDNSMFEPYQIPDNFCVSVDFYYA